MQSNEDPSDRIDPPKWMAGEIGSLLAGAKEVRLKATRAPRDFVELVFRYCSVSRMASLDLFHRSNLGEEKVLAKNGRLQLAPVLERYAERALREANKLIAAGFRYTEMTAKTPLAEESFTPTLRLGRPSTYAWYGGRFECEILVSGLPCRVSAADALFAGLRGSDGIRQIHAFLALLREELFCLEDLGALLLSIRRSWRPDPKCLFQRAEKTLNTPFSYTYLNYQPVEVELKTQLEEFRSDLNGYLGFESRALAEERRVLGPRLSEAARACVVELLLDAVQLQELLVNQYGLTKTKHGVPIVGRPEVLPAHVAGRAALLFTPPHTRRPSKEALEVVSPASYWVIDDDELLGASAIVERIHTWTNVQRYLLAVSLIQHYADSKPPSVLGLGHIGELVNPIMTHAVLALTKLAT